MDRKYKNIFEISQKELSQDAFLAWILQFADIETAEDYLSNYVELPLNLDQLKKELHELSLDLIKMFTGLSNIEVKSIEHWKQWENIDLWVQINDKYNFIIEDKTYTSDHDNQLERYKSIAEKWCKNYNQILISCCYYKSESYSLREKKLIESKGYKAFDRDDVLKILEEHKKAVFFDGVLFAYYCFLKNKSKLEEEYDISPVSEWENRHYIGFFKALDLKFHEDLDNWEYVNNPNGGFYGYWWHFKENQDGTRVYLQFEYNELQFENNKLCIKLGEVYENHSLIRDKFISKLERISKKYNIEIKKPLRYGTGISMTIGIINEKDWLVNNKNGYIDFEKTINKLQDLTKIIDELQE